MTRNELLRRYLDYGWTIVPVKKGTKMPDVNWKEYQTRKPTKEELRKWFTDPDVGVGLITGGASGVIVVDEDSYKEKGNAVPLETPLVVKTGGGGRHLYFKHIPGVNNTVNRDLAVDIRAEGGFVVLPPTLHPSGNHYEWETELPPTLEGLPTLAEESFLQEIFKRKASPETFEPLKVEDYMDVGEGSRNDSLYRMACSLFNKHDKDTAWKLLLAVNETYTPPLAEWEVKTIANSAFNFVHNHPSDEFKEKLKEQGKEDLKDPLQILTFKEADEKHDELMRRYGEGITTGYNVLDGYFKFLPRQLYMVSAPTHVGKTTIALNMAGRAARAGHKVIFASLEQGVFVVPRIKKMFASDEGLENLHLIAPDYMPSPEDFIELLSQDSNKPALLMVDHLHYFERGSKGATEEMDKLVVKMQMMANKLEIPVVVIAHVRKMNYLKPKSDKDGIVIEPPPTMDDLKDSSSLSQIPSVVIMLQRKRNPEEEIRAGGPVYSNEGTLFIYKNRIHGITGSEAFRIYDNGEIVFARDFNDHIASGAMPTPEADEENDIIDQLGI